MEIYEKPSMEVIMLDMNDIVTASGCLAYCPTELEEIED